MRGLFFSCILIAGPAVAAAPSPLASADAGNAGGAIDSGLWTEFKGRDRASWDAQQQDRYAALTKSLDALDKDKLSGADQAALKAMRVTLADWGDPSPAVANKPEGPACKDRNDRKL